MGCVYELGVGFSIFLYIFVILHVLLYLMFCCKYTFFIIEQLEFSLS